MELYSIQEISIICDKTKSRMSQIIKELSYDQLSENESRFEIYLDENDKRRKLYNREDTIKIIEYATKLKKDEIKLYKDLNNINVESFFKSTEQLKKYIHDLPLHISKEDIHTHLSKLIHQTNYIEDKYKKEEIKYNKEISELHQEIYENEDEISTLKSRLRHELRNNETISQNNKRWIEQNEELRNELNTLKMRNNLK